MSWFSFLKKEKPQKRLAILDVDDSNFKQQVIQRSFKTPVVVDFWAAWCGPCRQLGPILERIAEEPSSDFILAKLNTEYNQQTAARYNIYSIPAVKAFRNGQVIEEFSGAIPEALVRRFLSKVAATPPPPGQLKGSSDPQRRLKQAEQHLKKGRGFEAFVLLDNFPDGAGREQAEELLPLARFLFDMADGDGLTGVSALDEEYMAAAGSMARKRPQDALDHLLSARNLGVEIDSTYTDAVIESLLSLLGEGNPITQQFRQQKTGET